MLTLLHCFYLHACRNHTLDYILGIHCCCATQVEHKVNSGRLVPSPVTFSQVDEVVFIIWQSFILLLLSLFILPAPTCYSLLLPSPPSPPISSSSASFLLPYLQWHLLPCAFMCLLISQWSVSAHVCSPHLLGGFYVLLSKSCAAWITAIGTEYWNFIEFDRDVIVFSLKGSVRQGMWVLC